MTDMEHTIEQAAKVIQSAIEQQADVVADGMHLDVQGVLTPHWIAEALATNGLIAPAPLREEWGVDCYLGFEPEAYLERRNAEKHLAYEGGSLLRRYVTDWETP